MYNEKKSLPWNKMADNDNTLLTIVIIVIAALIILWLLWAFSSGGGVCIAATPDPVGGIKAESSTAGEVKISWDPSPNATHYRVFVNSCPTEVQSAVQIARKCSGYKAGACGDDCCPTTCTACVSKSNYKKLIETDDTELIIETCEPCICYIIVPYNRCNQAGPSCDVQFADVTCLIDSIEAWVVSNSCDGLTIGWNCPKCCDTVHIYVGGQLVDSVDAAAMQWSGAELPPDTELAVQCESSCGLGELNILVQGPVVAFRPQSSATKMKRADTRRRPAPRNMPAAKRQPVRKATTRPTRRHGVAKKVSKKSGPSRFSLDSKNKNVNARRLKR